MMGRNIGNILLMKYGLAIIHLTLTETITCFGYFQNQGYSFVETTWGGLVKYAYFKNAKLKSYHRAGLKITHKNIFVPNITTGQRNILKFNPKILSTILYVILKTISVFFYSSQASSPAHQQLYSSHFWKAVDEGKEK